MVQAGPRGDARVVAHEYHYSVSEEWIQEKIDEEGIERQRFWQIAFELRDLQGADARRKARDLREKWETIPDEIELAEPTEDPEAFLELLEEWVRERWNAQAEQARAQSAEQSRERQQQREFEADMDRWIEEEGSERLRLARERGYKVTSSYARERAATELPETWIDTAERADWRERVDPSFEALRVETSVVRWMEERNLPYSTLIVWLVEPPSSMAEALDKATPDEPFGVAFEQQEALLISDYLGKYRAFLMVDRDERAPALGTDQEEG
jgi:hypothetical protein